MKHTTTNSESWVHEVLDDHEPGDLDGRSVPAGTVTRRRRFGDYEIVRRAGGGSIWECTSHDLGKWTSEKHFELALIANADIPTGTIGVYKWICGSDGIYRVYALTTGRAIPSELRIGFSDEAELVQAVNRFNGEAR